MTPINPLPNIVPRTVGKPQVSKHDILFKMRIVSCQGKSLDAPDSQRFKLFSLADEELYQRLPREVNGWTYKDTEEVEVERLESYQPEFDTLEENGSEVQLYVIAIGASREIPFVVMDDEQVFPVSVKQLVNELPPLLKAIYGKHSIEMELHSIHYYQESRFVSTGDYVLS